MAAARPGEDARRSDTDLHAAAATTHERHDLFEDDDDDDEDAREREATELRPVTSHRQSITSETRSGRRRSPLTTNHHHQLSGIRKFWRNTIQISVPHDSCRDHLANERTYLAYLRTSLGFSFVGVVVAQLFHLQRNISPNATWGFYVLGKPMSLVFQGTALVICVLGTVRYFRQQHYMAVGKVHAGGWEILVIASLSALVLFGLFVAVLAVIVYKEEHPNPPSPYFSSRRFDGAT